MSSRADDAPAYFAEANSVTISLAPARDRKGVAIFQPLSGFTVCQLQRILPAPGQFQHATARFLGRPTDCAARNQIGGLEVATVDGVVRELLRDAPVKVLEITARNCLGLAHLRGLQAGFQLDVKSEIVCAFQIRDRCWILG